MWDPGATNVSKWLPPVDGHFYTSRVNWRSMNELQFTNILTPNGTVTRLWDDDDFWAPACARMTAELTRLRPMASEPQHQSKSMGVTVKHYGKAFPDPSNNTASISTYISVTVLDEGKDVLVTFANSCEWWFSILVGQAIVIHNATQSPTPIPLVVNGTTVRDQNSKVVMLPSPRLRGTSGGGMAVQAQDASNLTLWVEPVEAYASD